VPVAPDLCECLVDYRMVPGETRSSVLSLLSSLGAEASLVRREIACYTGYSEEAEAFFPAWVYRGELAEAARRGLGLETCFWRFGTDGSYTAGEAGIPTLGLGPGSEREAHKPDEKVPLDHLKRAPSLYARLARVLSRAVAEKR